MSFSKAVLSLAFIAFIPTLALAGTIIHVPQDQATIQAGIDAALDGDTVLVSPGTYYENIIFNGRAITVASANGPPSRSSMARQILPERS